MLKMKNLLDLEKKLVFFINFFLVLLIILTFLMGWDIEYFFYFNVILTFFVSYLFFKRSKKLAKALIVTNMFIFFYFLYPVVAQFLNAIFGAQSYIYVLLYSIILSYVFLVFSGLHKTFWGNLKNTDFKIILVVLIVGICIGWLFYLIKEPVPGIFSYYLGAEGLFGALRLMLFTSLFIAIGEQIIFSGFLFNTYRTLTTKMDAFVQTSVLFVMFHILRFEILVSHYFKEFNDMYLIFITLYYVFLFGFMFLALYLYSFSAKKYEGNFLYPVILHFGADFGLFLFYFLNLIS